MYSAIEVRNAITPNNLSPGFRKHFLSVLAVYRLPDMELGRFGIQNQTVKIKEKGLDFHMAAILTELYQ